MAIKSVVRRRGKTAGRKAKGYPFAVYLKSQGQGERVVWVIGEREYKTLLRRKKMAERFVAAIGKGMD